MFDSILKSGPRGESRLSCASAGVIPVCRGWPGVGGEKRASEGEKSVGDAGGRTEATDEPEPNGSGWSGLRVFGVFFLEPMDERRPWSGEAIGRFVMFWSGMVYSRALQTQLESNARRRCPARAQVALPLGLVTSFCVVGVDRR